MTPDPALDALTRAAQRGQYPGSVRNCHVQGLDSIVLEDRRATGQGMTRLYVTRPGHPLADLYGQHGFTIGVHNHHYDLTLTCVAGRFVNVEVDLTEWRFDDWQTPRNRGVFEYEFTSALAGGTMGVRRTGRTWQLSGTAYALAPGESRSMRHDQLHTVLALHDTTAWIVEEGPSVPGARRLLYSPDGDLRLSSDGLYEPMSNLDAHQTVMSIRGQYRRRDTRAVQLDTGTSSL